MLFIPVIPEISENAESPEKAELPEIPEKAELPESSEKIGIIISENADNHGWPLIVWDKQYSN